MGDKGQCTIVTYAANIIESIAFGPRTRYILKTKACMNRREYPLLLLVLCFFVTGEAWGWGGTAHKFINQNSIQHLPPVLAQLAAQQSFLTNHASDADSRKSSDPSESPKHYIDLESFADFRHLPADLSAVIAQYGWPAMQSYGVLPWTIVTTFDSLTVQFRRADWTKAYQSAADLGHYVGDANQPLHCTVNYDGQLTGNSGIHSRYESTMLGQYLTTIAILPDSIRYVSDVYGLALGSALHSLGYVDSIIQADNAAHTASGWTGTGTVPQQYNSAYYSTLWSRTGGYTRALLQSATQDIASLWYTAWVNAGVTEVDDRHEPQDTPATFALEQNYPNPFNPSTTIGFRIQGPGVSWVKLGVYDVLGREVANLVNEQKAQGTYSVHFDAHGLTSGTYFYRIQMNGPHEAFSGTKRMTLVR
jgi:hypothetical protein